MSKQTRRGFLAGAAAVAILPLPTLPGWEMPGSIVARLDDARLVLPDNHRFRYLTDGD